MITCEFEDGNKASLRHVVVDVLVVENDKILLAKRASRLSNGGKYGLIGGYVNRDETIEESVIREVEEETGYKVEIVKQLKVVDSPNRANEDRQNIAFLFLAKPLEKTGEPDDEAEELKWFAFGQLPRKEDFAFDHFESLNWYLENKSN